MTTAIRPEDRTSSATFDGQSSAVILDYWEPDVRAVQQIDAVPRILETVGRLTGMGLIAVARVTDERWLCCAVRDSIEFGMRPGSEMDIQSTICDEIRQSHQPVVIDEVAMDVSFASLHKKLHRFQSYISVPIMLKDGAFFGTLCAADPKPARLNNPETVGTIKLFADLIASELNAARSHTVTQATRGGEQAASEMCERFVAVLDRDLRNPLESIAAGVRMLSEESLDDDAAATVGLIRHHTDRMSRMIDDVLDSAREQLERE